MKQLKVHSVITRRTDNTARYINEISKIPLLSMDEEVDLAYRVQAGDVAARNKLVTHNLRFVISVANQYATAGVSQDDLINEGNMGLIRAAQTFDATRGFKFASYAVWWIRQAILLAITNEASSIRLPGNVMLKLQKYNKLCIKLMQEEGRTPTEEEVYELTGMAKEQLDRIKSSVGRVQSLDAYMSEDSETRFIDVVESDFDTAGNLISEDVKRTIVEVAEHCLSEREFDVVCKFYGIGQSPMTLEEIADGYDLTRERIRQIKERSLKKIYENERARARLEELFSVL